MERLKGQDLREAMLNWASSSSDSEEGEAEEEGEDEAGDVHEVAASALVWRNDGQVLRPPERTVQDGEETNRLAVMHMNWENIRVSQRTRER